MHDSHQISKYPLDNFCASRPCLKPRSALCQCPKALGLISIYLPFSDHRSERAFRDWLFFRVRYFLGRPISAQSSHGRSGCTESHREAKNPNLTAVKPGRRRNKRALLTDWGKRLPSQFITANLSYRAQGGTDILPAYYCSSHNHLTIMHISMQRLSKCKLRAATARCVTHMKDGSFLCSSGHKYRRAPHT